MSAPAAAEPKKDDHAKDGHKDGHKDHHKDKEHKKEEVKSTIPPRTIGVVGGTGSVGHAAALHLIKYQHNHHTTHKINVGVRDPKGAKGVELAKHQGLTVHEADMSKADTVAAFLKDHDVGLLVTPGTTEKRGEMVVNSANAAKKAGVKHIVVISVMAAETDTIFGKQFGPMEKAIKELGVKYTIVRLPMFADNLMGSKNSIVTQNTLYAPVKGSSKLDLIGVEDVGHFLSCLLAGPDLDKYANKVLQVSGPDVTTHDEIAKWFGESLKKDANAIKFVTIKPEDFIKTASGWGMPEWQAKGITELYALMDAGNPVASVVTDDFKNVVGHKPHSVSAWIGHQGHHFVPHPEEHKKHEHDKDKEKAAAAEKEKAADKK